MSIDYGLPLLTLTLEVRNIVTFGNTAGVIMTISQSPLRLQGR